MEHSKDLTRLCALMHIKNELQAARHAARAKEQRITTHIGWKQRGDWKKPTYSDGTPWRQGHLPKISEKLIKNSFSELRLMHRKAHIYNEIAKLKIGLFTKQYRKEMAAICKRNGWFTQTQGASTMYERIRSKAKDERQMFGYVVSSRKELTAIAVAQMLEDAMVKA